MSLYAKKLPLTFIICLLATLFMPAITSSIRLVFFAPFLVITFYQKSFFLSLCYALGCGVICDLLSADIRFGVHALSFCVTTLVLYQQKKNFFADSISTLPMMTFFFSVLTTLVDFITLYALQQPQLFSWEWVVCDLLVMPALDGLTAFLVFSLPGLLFGSRVRKGEDYFTSNAGA